MDQELRNRIVELALEQLDSTNPLAVDDGLPPAGLRDQAEDLLSLLEFAGLFTPDAVADRFRVEGLDAQLEPVRELTAAFESARTDVIGDGIANSTLRGERYDTFLSTDTTLDALFPAVDAVILGGFTLFSPLERRLVDAITDTWPTAALLPQTTPPQQQLSDGSPTLSGVDRGAERALQAYDDLGFTSEYCTEFESSEQETRHRIAQRLYRHPGAFDTATITDTAGIDWVEPRTVPQELRYIARDIHSRLIAGADPDDLAVVLTSPGSYQQQLHETFESYGIPMALTTTRPLGATAVGEIVRTICELTRSPRRLASVTSLFANPLVAPETLAVDHTELDRIASRLSSAQLAPALDHLPAGTTAALTDLQTRLDALQTTDLASLPDQIAALLDDLGIENAVEAIDDNRRQDVEQRALDTIDRILETLAATHSSADLAQGGAVKRFERALATVSVEAPPYRSDGHVFVGGLGDTMERSFAHTYVVGLTHSAFPSESHRLAFTEPINEADEDFQQADIQHRVRLQFATILASAGSVTLSRPERQLNGDPFVEADVLTELRRVAALKPTSVTDRDQPACSREDGQRTLARQLSHDSQPPSDVVGQAATTEVFTPSQLARLQAGTECAHARKRTAPTEYDGVLNPEQVSALHPASEREPYSPSRLETYAECGFKYYLEHLLEIEEPEPITHEPDAKTRGGYLHDVLERYYRSGQSDHGTPVAVPEDETDFDECCDRLLAIAVEQIDDWFTDDPTAFQDEWLTQLLAGLGDPGENPYYGSAEHGSPEEGLFVRFLEHEQDDIGKACVRPAWFESKIGTSHGDSPSLRDDPVQVSTPSGTVPVGGKIDRIDRDLSSDQDRIVVRDYKTGSTPGERETLAGISFQLPLYALLAESVFDTVEAVGGAYYQVKPPRHAKHRRGQIGSQELASYARSGGGTPLTYWRKPEFETHAEFRQFLADTIPQRLEEITTGIEQGWYHPTILDASDAGCSYCAYSEVCDVRHHDRRETLAEVQAADGMDTGAHAYVPLAATGDDLELGLAVETDGGGE
ncbi:PD-(D/E)XK nuclease family protein [Halomicrococcus sp. NG-SE-24]|uniref:PD-(D/E)XK nuclease family protein n=1 Tax=Halomicrococcus sp. NG-SE-24 TaxID=3436928 RepID=UPI003D99A258